MAAFVKDDPAKAASLVAKIQNLATTHKAQNLRAYVVFLGGPEMKPALEKVAAEKKIKIAMAFLPGGAGQEDVEAFRLNPAAKNTILLYRRNEVKQNFVNVDEASFPEVARAAAALVGQ